MADYMHEHECDTWAEYDAQGIYLARVCDACVERVLAGYRPEILSGYTQADVDEPIGEDSFGDDREIYHGDL